MCLSGCICHITARQAAGRCNVATKASNRQPDGWAKCKYMNTCRTSQLTQQSEWKISTITPGLVRHTFKPVASCNLPMCMPGRTVKPSKLSLLGSFSKLVQHKLCCKSGTQLRTQFVGGHTQANSGMPCARFYRCRHDTLLPGSGLQHLAKPAL